MLCFKGAQACFYGGLRLFIWHEKRQSAIENEQRLTLLTSPGSQGKEPAKPEAVNVGLLRFWMRTALQRLVVDASDEVLALIIEFARPPLPNLALLGSLQVHARRKCIRHGSARNAVTIHGAASDGNLLAYTLETPGEVVVWRLPADRPFHHTICRGAAAPTTCVWIHDEGNRVAAGCENGNVYIWCISTGECIGRCEYYDWFDRCGSMRLGHQAAVTTVDGGAVFNSSGTDIISGDAYGILCAWQISSSSNEGNARLCVNVSTDLGYSVGGITCCTCRENLVVCGLREGLAIGYFAYSRQCAFLLGVPLPSPLLALSLSIETADVVGCFANGSVLQWSLHGLESTWHRVPVLPECLADAAIKHQERSKHSYAHASKQHEDVSIVWMSKDESSDFVDLRWSALDARGQLRVLEGSLPWSSASGDLQGVVQLT